jgi:O-antigen/teichoic acid export membrane protein
MALAMVFVQGLDMFSDLGLGASIVQQSRGEEPAFLDTVWTLQVIRGLVLWICACLLAPFVGAFYGEPLLAKLLPVLGLTALIAGFNSTRLATANRKLQLGRLSLLELASSAIGLTVMVAWACWTRSVWALAAGALAGSLVKMILSHLVLPGSRNYFAWDPKSFQEIRRFGQWIFASTAITFFAGQGDRVVLGALLDLKTLGILGIATTLAGAANELLAQLTQRVLFPSYAQLVREHPERVRNALRRARVPILAVGWSAALVLVGFGERLVQLLYDDRYADVGWMLRLIATGMLIGTINMSYRGIFIAFGRTSTQASLVAIRVVLKFALIFTGYSLGGTAGLVIAIAFESWVSYPVYALFWSRLSVLQLEVDLPLIGAAVLLTGLLYF